MTNWRLYPYALAAALLVMGWVSAFGQEAQSVGKPDRELLQLVATALAVAPDSLQLGASNGIARAVTSTGDAVAYLGSTWDIAHTAGYSGRPINILVLVDTRAVIRGAWLIEQQEPILTLGIDLARLGAFVAAFIGYDLTEPLQPVTHSQVGAPDAIAGATISSGVMRNGILRTARVMATTYDLLPGAAGGTVDTNIASLLDWSELVSSRAVVHLDIANAQADQALGLSGGGDPAASFIDLYLAVLDPPRIGASLLGQAEFTKLVGGISATDHIVLIAANGLYSYKGTAWRNSGIFDRIEIAQGTRTIPIETSMYHPVESLAAKGAPEFREVAVFAIPAGSGFDPTLPFRLSLIASREVGADTARIARFSLDYQLPGEFISRAITTAPAVGEPALWQENWRARIPTIATVVTMLLGLYLILIFQDQIASRPLLYSVIRLGYLLATVAVLGIIIGAQLSVVHVLTFLQELRTGFSWETFLLDPATFIIWSWVAVAVLFWGRVYCGWLCPFGALQELVNKAARWLGLRQVTIPFALHERLWPIKYIIFLGLFAASLASMTMAIDGAEVEPFKTVIVLRFMREWPFIAYALALLLANLFVERFFCRYLCPLGAAIAIPARVRMFEWLKRRPQCGRECRICSVNCPVQAIHPEGQINPNECIYCLNCQTLYHNEHICPPLKQRAVRRAAYAAAPRSESQPS